MILQFLKNTLAWVGITAITVQPIFAQSITGAGPQAPTVLTTANGTPIVDVNTPNAAGVSMNTYGTFNVGPGGVILNNGTENYVLTNLGGYVHGNANLQGGPASLIISQVVNPNSSSLNGYIEVAGNQANVVIANPYGITCDGCGFINTDRAVLTTGTPHFGSGGTLDSFSVSQGVLTIGQGGADARGVSDFDLIARKIVFNGTVQGQRVRVIAGQNDVVFATGATSARPSDGSAAPDLAIDSSVFGGMYANKITIVSTEQGVGVKAPDTMSAGAGGMHITADGRLVLGQAVSQGQTNIQAQRVTVKREVRSQEALSIEAREQLILEADAVIVSGAAADIEAVSDVTFDANAQLYAANTLNLTSGGAFVLGDGAKAMATGDVTIQAQSADMAQNSLVFAGVEAADATTPTSNLSFTIAQDFVVQSGQVYATGTTDIQTATLTVDTDNMLPASQFVSGGNMVLQGNQLDLNGVKIVSEGSLQINATTGLTTSDGSVVAAALGLTIQAGEIALTATLIEAGDDLNVTTTGDMSATDTTLVATNDATLSASDIDLSGTTAVANTGAMSISSRGDSILEGTFAAGTNLTISAAHQAIVSGDLTAQQTLTFSADDISANGTLAADRLNVAALGNLTSQANLIGVNDVRLESNAATTLSGQITSGGHLTVSAVTTLSSSASSSATGTLSFTAGSDLLHSGTFQSGAGVIMQSGGALVQSGTGAASTGASALTIQLTGQSVTNSGSFVVADTLRVTATGRGIAHSGSATAGGDVIISATGTTEISGALVSLSDLTISSASLGVATTGSVQAVNTASLTAQSGDVSVAGILLADSGLMMVSNQAALDVSGTVGSNAGAITANSASLNISGALQAASNISLNIAGAATLSGQVASDKALALSSGSFTLSGQVVGLDSVSVTTTVDDLTSGSAATIASQGDITLLSQGAVNIDGVVQSGGAVSVTSGTTLASDASIATVTDLTLVSGANLVNIGSLQSGRNITLASVTSLHNTGAFGAVADIQLTAGTTVTNAGNGLFASNADAANVSFTGQSVTNSGTFDVVGSVDFESTAGTLVNSGAVLSGGHLSLTATGGALNNTGTLISLSTLILDGNSTVSSTGSISSAGAISVAGTTIITSGLMTSEENIVLQSSVGDVTSGARLEAGQAITLQSAQDMTVSGDTLSGTGTTFTTGGSLNQSGNLFSAAGITMSAQDTLSTSGDGLNTTGASATILDIDAAQITASGDLVIATTIYLDATGTSLVVSGDLTAGAHITADAATQIDVSGSLFAMGTSEFTASSLTNSGSVTSLSDLTLIIGNGGVSNNGTFATNTDLVATSSGAIIQSSDGAMTAAGGGLTLSASSTDIAGVLTTTQDLSITTATMLDLSAEIYSGDSITLTGASAVLGGDITALGTLSATTTTGNLTVSGVSKSNNALTLTAAEMLQTNSGSSVFASSGGVTLTSSTVGATTASGVVIAGDVLSNTSIGLSGDTANVTGTLASGTGITVTSNVAGVTIGGTVQTGLFTVTSATDIVNSGTVHAATSLTANGNITNSGTLNTYGLSVVAVDFTNTGSGSIASQAQQTFDLSGSFFNAGTLSSATNIVLAADVDTINQGTVDATNALVITTPSITNQAGAILEGGTVVINTPTVNNAGTILSQGVLSIGDLAADGTTSIPSATVTNAGLIEAQGNAFISTQTLANSGTINGFGASLALSDLQSFDNTGGKIYAANTLSLQISAPLDVTGASWGTVDAAGHLILSGIDGGYLSGITIGSGQVFSNSGDLSIKTEFLTNHGTLASGTGNLVVQSNGDITNTGLIYGGGEWTILRTNGTVTNDAGVILAKTHLAFCGNSTDNCLDDLSIDRAALVLNRNGGVVETVSGNMLLAADAVTNETQVNFSHTNGSVGYTTNVGFVEGGITFNANEGGYGNSNCSNGCYEKQYLNHAAQDETPTRVTLLGASYTNEKLAILSKGPLSQLISGGSIIVNAGSFNNNYGLVSASQDITFQADTIANRGVQEFDINALTLDLSKSIGNRGNSSHIHAFARDPGTYTVDFRLASYQSYDDDDEGNGGHDSSFSRSAHLTGFRIGSQTYSFDDLYGDRIVPTYATRTWRVKVGETDNGNDIFETRSEVYLAYNTLLGVEQTTTQTQARLQLNLGSTATYGDTATGLIEAGGNINGTVTGSVTNGEISPNDPNRTTGSSTAPTVTGVSAIQKTGTDFAGVAPTAFASLQDALTETATQAAARNTVAGSNVGLGVQSTTLDGLATGPAVTLHEAVIGTSAATPVALDPIGVVTASDLSISVFPGNPATTVPAVDTTGFGNENLFTISANAPNGYIVETAHEFIDLSAFVSSDYFLNLLGFDPDETQLRYGDALVETYLIRDQLLELTGQRLLDSNTSEADQIRELYQNAAAANEGLNLTPGVALTPSQVASLTDNLIWLEETVVNGQTALVPRVYLSAGYEILDGAVIEATNVAFEAESFETAGIISADDNLTINAANSLSSTGGIITAGNTVRLDAQDGTISLGGTALSAKDVQIVAQSVDVFTNVDELTIGGVGQQSFGAAATITANNSLSIFGQDVLTITGADLSAGGDITLLSDGDITIRAAEETNHRTGYNFETLTTNLDLASIESINGNLAIVSTGMAEGGGHVELGAVQATAGGNVSVLAQGGNVLLTAQAATDYSFSKVTSSSLLSKSSTTTETLNVTYTTTSLTGDNVTIYGAGTVLDQAAILNATDGDLLKEVGVGNIVNESVANIAASNVSTKKSSFFGLFSSSSTERTLLTQALASNTTASNDITFRTGGNLIVEGGTYNAGGNIQTDIGGNTVVLATVDTDFFSGTYNNNNGITITDTTVVEVSQTAGFPQFTDSDGTIEFDPDSAITIGLEQSQAALGTSASGLLTPPDGAEQMGLLDYLLPDATGPPAGTDILGQIYSDQAAAAQAEREAKEKAAREEAEANGEEFDLEAYRAAQEAAAEAEAANAPAPNPAYDFAGSKVDVGVPSAEDGAAFAYLDDLQLRDNLTVEEMQLVQHSFYDEQTTLNPAFQALLTAAVSFYAPGIFNIAGGLGLQPGALATGLNVFASNVGMGVLGGAITGDMDLGAILEGAALSGLTAGLTAGVSGVLGTSDFVTGLNNDSLIGLADGTFSIQSLTTGLIDTTISSGVQSLVYGTSFGDTFSANLEGMLMAEVTTAMHNVVGDMVVSDSNPEGIFESEGSFGHAVAHAVVGCLSAELQGADCGAGAAGGLSASLFSGAVAGTAPDPIEDPDGYAAWQAQTLATASMIGSTVGYVFSGSDAANVTTTAAITQSGVKNNYLTHKQRAEAERLKQERVDLRCARPRSNNQSACAAIDQRLAKLERLSTLQTVQLLNACRDNSSSKACQTGLQQASDYVEWRASDAGQYMGRFDVDLGNFYHAGLDGAVGGDLDGLIVDAAQDTGMLDLQNVADFNQYIDDAIEDQLVFWGDDRLKQKAELLGDLSGLDDSNDPLVESTCYTASSAYPCMSNKRRQIEDQLAVLGVVDFFVPSTAEGLMVEIALLGTGGVGKLVTQGGKTFVRMGDELVEFTADGAGGYRVAGEATNNAGTPIKQYSDGSFRTPDGKFASQGGLPAPGTKSAQEYTQYLRDNGFDVVGEELTVNAAVSTRRYDAVVRTNNGELWGIEYKSGGASKTRQQNFNDMYMNKVAPADGVGQIAGEQVVGNITIYLP